MEIYNPLLQPMPEKPKKPRKSLVVLIVSLFSLLVFSFGLAGGFYLYRNFSEVSKVFGPFLEPYNPLTSQNQPFEQYSAPESYEQAIISAVKSASPSVVSIIVTKDMPVFEEYYIDPFENFPGFGFPDFKIPQYRQKGTEKKEIGGGTGFIISEDGMILTNRHVASDEQAQYTVLTNDGSRFQAKVLARDQLQDLAVLKIDSQEAEKFSVLKLGDSANLQIGQTVIAIGNALGEFRNTVSVGVVSGLQRNVTATGPGLVENIDDVIQTDAAINPGNSGGPLLNLKGEVIGINTAIASGAENIGFALPINKAKRAIESIKESGKITYPFLGVRYATVTDKIKQEKGLDVDYGALIIKGENNEPAVVSGSAADQAGLKEGDIVLFFGAKKVDLNNPLTSLIQDHRPGETVEITVLRDGQQMKINVVLGERTN